MALVLFCLLHCPVLIDSGSTGVWRRSGQPQPRGCSAVGWPVQRPSNPGCIVGKMGQEKQAHGELSEILCEKSSSHVLCVRMKSPHILRLHSGRLNVWKGQQLALDEGEVILPVKEASSSAPEP